MPDFKYISWFAELQNTDVDQFGGKNASLGEMVRHLEKQGVRVPGGFATSAQGYRKFIEHNKLDDKIRSEVQGLDGTGATLKKRGAAIRRLILRSKIPPELENEIREAYQKLSREQERSGELAVAVRSSATAEDLPDASFAGQQETYLNVRGPEDLLKACRKCFASLFTDRAINYRQERGFDQLKVALSVGVQKMVRSDTAGAGVMFSLDTDSGFPDIVVINASWGLGETVVKGMVSPDEYRVFKPRLGEKALVPILEKTMGSKEKKIVYSNNSRKPTKTLSTPQDERKHWVLTDEEILQLAQWAVAIEKHYQRHMDMEWAKDGETGKLYCVQARPETVHSQRQGQALKTYQLQEKSKVLCQGVAVGQSIATGKVRILKSPEQMDQFESGDILVTGRTDPDWGPIMKKAAAIVTDQGGRTSHAAIVSRELGIPALVGTQDATTALKDKQEVTVACSEGHEGHVYEGSLKFQEDEVDLEALQKAPVRIMLNLAAPDAAFRWWKLPVQGIGLARMEFIISNVIKIHPLALCRFEEIKDAKIKKQIEKHTAQYSNKKEYFIDHLSRGIASIAASQYPAEALVRMSDLKSNEYAELIGGRQFEVPEENPMLGFRGASRYYSPEYRDAFDLECCALKRAREVLGLDNISLMIPFVRSLEEADRVLEILAENGLERGHKALRIHMMAELPSNVFLADQFAQRFDGFSIGTNDLTQLVLGVDRDSPSLSDLFDERSEAVQVAIAWILEEAHKMGIKVGTCGQAPSDYPDFAQFLVDSGIDSISLNPDSVAGTLKQLNAGPSQTRQRESRASL